MEVKKSDRGEKQGTKILDSDEFKIVSVSEGAENVNADDIDKKEANLDIEISSAFLFDADRRYKKEDLKYNFIAFKWAAWLKLSPFGVDENSKNFPRLRIHHKKWWGNGISVGWFLLASLRVFIFVLSTAHFGMTQDTKENLHQMTMMIALTTCNGLLVYAMASGLFPRAQNMAPFLLSIFKYLDADADAEIEGHSQKFGFRFRGHTLKELLIVHFPFFIYSLIGMIPLLSAVDPSFPILLVSLVQPEISFSFLTLATLDTIVVLYYCMIVHMNFYAFMGMHRIAEEAGFTINKLSSQTTPTPTENENEKDNSIKIQKALKNLGLLHIWTTFCNRSFSNVVYCCKLIGLTASVLGGFGFVKMIEVENWAYAGIFSLLFLEGIIGYNLIFARAFEIPEKIKELKREIRKQSFKTYKNNPVERKYVEKYLRSIPWLGVKDGVYKMERLTCVNFMCFVTEQISSLVLAY